MSSLGPQNAAGGAFLAAVPQSDLSCNCCRGVFVLIPIMSYPTLVLTDFNSVCIYIYIYIYIYIAYIYIYTYIYICIYLLYNICYIYIYIHNCIFIYYIASPPQYVTVGRGPFRCVNAAILLRWVRGATAQLNALHRTVLLQQSVTRCE